MNSQKRLSVGLMTPTLEIVEPCDMDRLRHAARVADEGSIDVLWVGDHLLWHVPILDVTVTLGMLAAETKKVMLGTNVLQLPLRPPIYVAKAFATLSYLTEGRVLLGVGVGGEYEPESRAAGVKVRERGRRADEGLRMLRSLWDGEPDQGDFYDAPGVPLQPGPVSRIPIWVGGRSDAAYRRAASQDGYLGYMLNPSRFAEARQKILDAGSVGADFAFGMQFMTRIGDSRDRALSEAVGSLSRTYNTNPRPFEKYVAAGTPEDVAAFIDGFIEQGLTHASFFLHGEGWSEQVERLTKEVLPLLGRDESIHRNVGSTLGASQGDRYESGT